MKKSFIILFAIFGIVLFITNSCNKASDVPFEHATMKPFFDSQCASCHASGGSASSSWKYNSNDYSTIKNHISSIYQNVYVRKTMPPSGISTTELNAFKAWYDAGYPAK